MKQKVSAFWSVATLGFSLAAVLVGGLTALLNSTAITPSLRRRWEMKGRGGEMDKPFEISLPVRVAEDEVEAFKSHVIDNLYAASGGGRLATRGIKQATEEGALEKSWTVDFVYYSPDANVGASYARNHLTLSKKSGEANYTASLSAHGDEKSTREAGAFIRNVLLEWSIIRKGLKDQANGGGRG